MEVSFDQPPRPQAELIIDKNSPINKQNEVPFCAPVTLRTKAQHVDCRPFERLEAINLPMNRGVIPV